ncbi:MAG: polyprenyl synthetase family protein [Gemmatimonadaceae bacterium]
MAARPATVAPPTLGAVQRPVRDDLDHVVDELRRIVTEDNPLISEVNGHLLQMRGKMFRPTLLLLSSETGGSQEPRAIALAAVVELIHLATLVHDDAIDHSALRRGMPTVNALFSHQVSVIMGDFLYSRALWELVRRDELEALRLLTAASNAMTVGEMRQLAVVDPLSFSEADYDALIRAKTAALFAAACEVGALCGAEAHRAALARYGERLGMAFQISDDLLDYTEAQEVTGKPMGLDLREHKVTLPLIHALSRITPAARARINALFAAEDPGSDEIAGVIAIVRDAGGLEYARSRGEQFAHEAEEALAELPETDAAQSLSDAIGYVMDRRR